LIQPLAPNALDIVGDVHGEIDALRNVLTHLGYGEDGVHPDGRHLVFLGDLIDRGPDSPAVIELVARCVEAGNAQCVMGNHELNILRNERKHGNGWFFGESEALSKSGPITPQKLADEDTRETIRRFCRPLPLALERDDLRIVHACWQEDMLAIAGKSSDALTLYRSYRDAIDSRLSQIGTVDKVERNLHHQNENPAKVLTSGIERRANRPFETNGKLRSEARWPWWNGYADTVLCVFGHYERLPTLDGKPADPLFCDCRLNAALGNGYAMCIDYGMAHRWEERLEGQSRGTRLGVLRFPEREIVFDDGERLPLDMKENIK